MGSAREEAKTITGSDDYSASLSFFLGQPYCGEAPSAAREQIFAQAGGLRQCSTYSTSEPISRCYKIASYAGQAIAVLNCCKLTNYLLTLLFELTVSEPVTPVTMQDVDD